MAKRETTDELKKRVRDVIRRLKRAYPDAHTSLHHTNAFQLLVATILSAQSTDERVNIVTADLFRKYRKPEDYLKVSAHELEKDIHSPGSSSSSSIVCGPPPPYFSINIFAVPCSDFV